MYEVDEDGSKPSKVTVDGSKVDEASPCCAMVALMEARVPDGAHGQHRRLRLTWEHLGGMARSEGVSGAGAEAASVG